MSLHSGRPSRRPSGTCPSLGTPQCAMMWYDRPSCVLRRPVPLTTHLVCDTAKREAPACSGARGQAPTRSPGPDARLRPLRQPPRGRRVDDRSARLQPAKQWCVLTPDSLATMGAGVKDVRVLSIERCRRRIGAAYGPDDHIGICVQFGPTSFQGLSNTDSPPHVQWLKEKCVPPSHGWSTFGLTPLLGGSDDDQVHEAGNRARTPRHVPPRWPSDQIVHRASSGPTSAPSHP
jgi:hypothetical protein